MRCSVCCSACCSAYCSVCCSVCCSVRCSVIDVAFMYAWRALFVCVPACVSARVAVRDTVCGVVLVACLLCVYNVLYLYVLQHVCILGLTSFYFWHWLVSSRDVRCVLLYFIKSGLKPLENEINEILSSKREDRFLDPFFWSGKKYLFSSFCVPTSSLPFL